MGKTNQGSNLQVILAVDIFQKDNDKIASEENRLEQIFLG